MQLFKSLFSGGAASLSAADAKTRLDSDPTLFILDVRQPDEFRGGHIANSKLIPLGELGQRLAELPKDREILCVCRSGSRSGMAAQQLSAAGYQVINLQGGLMAWAGAGYPLKQGKA